MGEQAASTAAVSQRDDEQRALRRLEQFKKRTLHRHVLVADERVAALAAAIRKYGIRQISVDFETASKNGRYGIENTRLRLVQIGLTHPAFGGTRQYVIDCDQADPRLLNDVFRDGRIEKLIHWSPFEQSNARVFLGVEIANVYDTGFAMQSINKELGRWLEREDKGRAAVDAIRPGWEWHRASLTVACEKLLGMELPKEMQLSDWSGELTEDQLDYAALDVAVLPPLARETKKLARQLGISRRIWWRADNARKEAIEAWPEDAIDRADDSREICWKMVYAASVSELEEIWSQAKRLTLAARNRDELANLFEARRAELEVLTAA